MSVTLPVSLQYCPGMQGKLTFRKLTRLQGGPELQITKMFWNSFQQAEPPGLPQFSVWGIALSGVLTGLSTGLFTGLLTVVLMSLLRDLLLFQYVKMHLRRLT